MRKVGLDKLVKKLESGSRPRGGVDEHGDIFSLGGEHLTYNAEFNWKNKKYISNKYFSKLKSGKIQTDDILIVKDGATTGKVCFVGDTFPFEEAAINEHLFRLEVDKSKVNPHYLFWYLYSSDGQKEILKDLRGATVGGISRKFISLANIPLPDRKTQQDNIANILNKVHKLILDRKHSISIIDKLVKSIFLEMFGDPYLNTKEWKLVKISSFVDGIKSGWSAKGQNRQIQKDELGVLKVSAVTSGYFKPEQHKAVDKLIIKKQLVHPQKGDLLFSRANTKELVAATCVVDKDYQELFLPDKLWRIDLNKEKVQTFYFKYVLTNTGYRTNLARKATGTSGSMLNISQVKFRKHLFPLPPIELQKRFELIVEKAIAEKQKLEKSLTDSEKLFKSLLQKAFRGELEFVDENVELQTSLKTINWYESQLSLLKATQAIAEQQRQIEKVLSEPLKNIKAVQETIQKMNLPALEAIKSFQKTLHSLKVPALDAIKTMEQFQIVKDSSTQLGIAEEFKIPAFEEYQEEIRLKEIEEELARENDPTLRYIREKKIVNGIVLDLDINIARLLHAEFKGQEFSLNDLVIIADNGSKDFPFAKFTQERLKKELFYLFKVFVRIEFNQFAFTFNQLAQTLKKKLCNPTYDLLNEFITEELLNKNEIRQAYFPGIMNSEYPEHYKQLKYSDSPFRLYLIHTNGNSKN